LKKKIQHQQQHPKLPATAKAKRSNKDNAKKNTSKLATYYSLTIKKISNAKF
jgi:hypothetical protein